MSSSSSTFNIYFRRQQLNDYAHELYFDENGLHIISHTSNDVFAGINLENLLDILRAICINVKRPINIYLLPCFGMMPKDVIFQEELYKLSINNVKILRV